MEGQITAKLDELQRPLRLPKEHETGKQVMYIIVQYGKLYPCRNADFSRNETDIHWTTTFASDTAEPIRSEGIDPAQNGAALENYFRGLSSDSVYVVFCTFEDSFPAFLRAKQMAVASGITYGWDAFQNSDGPVTFGEVGNVPKAQ